MRKRIVLERGQITEIFGCSPQFIGQCLRYQVKYGRDGIALRIRERAIREYNGMEKILK
jgi:hypothetical protein